MGVVFRARDERLEREVAVKVLSAGVLADESARKRFRGEALALSRLNHPNIGTIFDFDTQDGVDFLVMEFVPGETLAKRLARGALAENDVITLGMQIARALEEAHERGVVHRDLKPGNIIVTPKGQAKVLDFGLAAILRPATDAETTKSLTQTQGPKGTLPYMAPEQLRTGKADTRSDIWALGVVLYEMATGRLPFPETPWANLIEAILTKVPPTPKSLNRAITTGLGSVVLKALEKDPQRRYRTATDLKLDLERLSLPRLTTPRPRAVKYRGALAGVAGLSLLALLVSAHLGRIRGRLFGITGPQHIKALAVLPLENLSRDRDQEYFADGMTDELITDLARIRALRVISRTSIMHYKGTQKTIPEIARELNVDAMVEGTVLRSGARVRITAQLIDTATDRHLWAEEYERDLQDVLLLQSQVARAIAQEIQITLTSDEQARLASAKSVNPDAHEAYLRGRYYWNMRTEKDLKRGIEYFERATTLDPRYALGYAGLADSYSLLGSRGLLPPRDAFPKAKAAAVKALELDEAVAEAHTSLACVRAFYDWDWEGAQGEFQRAIALNPNYATAHHWYALFLANLGRQDEAVGESKRAQQIDPLSPIINADAGLMLFFARRYDEAIDQYRKSLETDPYFAVAHRNLGDAYMKKGMNEAAATEFQKAIDLSRGDPGFVASLGYFFAVIGRRGEALKVLDTLKALSKQRYVAPSVIALIYVGLGEKNTGFEWLEKAYEERDAFFLKLDPAFDTLRSDPRYANLLIRFRLPP